MHFRKYEIFGCPCVAMHEREAIAHLISLVRAEKSGYLVAINAEKIQRFSKDPMMKSIILNSNQKCEGNSCATMQSESTVWRIYHKYAAAGYSCCRDDFGGPRPLRLPDAR